MLGFCQYQLRSADKVEAVIDLIFDWKWYKPSQGTSDDYLAVDLTASDRLQVLASKSAPLHHRPPTLTTNFTFGTLMLRFVWDW